VISRLGWDAIQHAFEIDHIYSHIPSNRPLTWANSSWLGFYLQCEEYRLFLGVVPLLHVAPPFRINNVTKVWKNYNEKDNHPLKYTCIHFLSSLTFTPCSGTTLSTRNWLQCSWIIVFKFLSFEELANLSQRFSLMFCSLGTCLSWKTLNPLIRVRTRVKYWAKWGLFTWYSYKICSVTKSESFFVM